MVAAWVSGAIAYACLLQCEACIWISPRAEQALGGALQTECGSLLTGCGLELAEALCGTAGDRLCDALLQELLDGFGVPVLCGSAVLRPAVTNAEKVQLEMPQLTHKDLASLKAELRADMRRSLEASEMRLSEVVKTSQDTL